MGEGIRLILEIPTKTNMDEVIKQVKAYTKDKITANIGFTWTKKDLNSTLSEMSQYIKQRPINTEITTYFNKGSLNAQIQGVQNELNKANLNVKAAVTTSGSASTGTSGYTPTIVGALSKQSDVLINGDLVKTVSDYNVALGKTAQIVENFSTKGSNFKQTLTTSDDTIKKTTQSLKLFQSQANIDVVKFKDRYTGLFDEKQLNTWTDKVKNLTPTTQDLSYRMQSLNKEFGMMKAESASRGLDLVNKSSMTLGETLKIAFERFPVWIIASTAIMGIIHQINDAFSFITESNTKLTTLQMEMTQSKLDFADLTKQSNAFAFAMGNITGNVISAISIFGNYNSTMEETISRSKSAILLTNLSGQSITESSNTILAMQEQFGYASTESGHLVDILAGTARMLQLDYPVAIKEVSSGIQRVGSVANESGISLERLSSMIGTVAESTRMHGEVIGNAYKTIFSRMTAVTEEINPEEYKKIEKTFNDIGIAIKSSATDIRPLSDVLDDLHNKWSSLNSVQKNQIATESAGIRQKNIFLNMMERYDEILSNTEQATNSLGIAQSKQDIYMQSIQAHLNQFKASLEGLYSTLINSGSIKGIVDMASSAVNAFSKFSSIVGGIPALFTATAVGIGLFSTKLNGIIGQFVTLRQLTEMQKTNIGLVPTFSVGGLSAIIPLLDKIKANKNVIKEAFDVGKNFSISNAIVNTYNNWFDNTAKRLQEMPVAMQGAKGSIVDLNKEWNNGATIGDRFKNVIGMIGNAGNVAKGGILGLSAAMKALEIGAIGAKIATVALQAALTLSGAIVFSLAFGKIMEVIDNFIHRKEKAQEAFNELKSGISTLSSETTESTKLISTYNALSNETNLTAESKEKLYSVMEKLGNLFPGAVENFDSEGKIIKLNTELLKQYLDQKKQDLEYKKQEMVSTFNAQGDKDLKILVNNANALKNKQTLYTSSLVTKEDKAKYLKDIQDLRKESDTAFQEIQSGLMATFQDDQKFKDLGSSGILLLIRTITNESVKMGNTATKSMEDLINSIASSGALDIGKSFQEKIKSYQSGSISYNDLLQQQAIEVDKFNEKLNNIPNLSEDAKKAIRDIFLGMPVEKATKDVTDFSNAIKKIEETTTETSGTIELYNQILEKAKTSNNDAAQEVMKHVGKHRELYDAIDVENGILVLNTGKLENLKKKTIEEKTEAIDAQINKTNQVDQETKKRLKSYGIEIDKLKELSVEYMNYISRIQNEGINYQYQNDPSNLEAYKKKVQIMQDLNNVYLSNQLNTIEKTKENGQKLFDYWYNLEIANNTYKDQKEIDARVLYVKNLIEGAIDASVSANKSKALLKTPNLGITDPKGSKGDPENEMFREYKNNVKSLELELQKLKFTRESLIQGSDAYGDSIHQEAELKRQELALVQAEIEKYGGLKKAKEDAYSVKDNKAKQSLDLAMKEVENGTPYAYGGNELGAKVDCSGLVQQIYKQIGVEIDRTADNQYYNAPIKPSKEQLQPGDLVFFDGSDPPYGHVAIYMGDGKMIEAPYTGANVRVSDMNSRSDYAGAGRYLDPATGYSVKQQHELNDIQQHRLDMTKREQELESDIQKLSSSEWWNNKWKQYENEKKQIEDIINLSKAKQQFYSESSLEYLKETQIQIDAQKKLEDINKREMATRDAALQSENVKGEDILNNMNARKQLSIEELNIQKSISDLYKTQNKTFADIVSTQNSISENFRKSYEGAKVEGVMNGLIPSSPLATNYEKAMDIIKLDVSQMEKFKSAYQTFVTDYQTNTIRWQKMFGDKYETYKAIAEKINAGQSLSDTEQAQWDVAISKTGDMGQALKETAAMADDAAVKTEAFKSAWKTTQLLDAAVTSIENVQQAVENYKNTLEDMEFNEQFESQFGELVKKYQSLYDDIPTDPLELQKYNIEQSIEEEKTAVDDLVSKLKTLENIKFQADSGELQEALQKVKDSLNSDKASVSSSTADKTTTLSSDKLKSYLSGISSLWTGDSLGYDAFVEKLNEVSSELSTSYSDFSTYTGQIITQLGLIKQAKEDYANATDNVGRATAHTNAELARMALEEIVSEIGDVTKTTSASSAELEAAQAKVKALSDALGGISIVSSDWNTIIAQVNTKIAETEGSLSGASSTASDLLSQLEAINEEIDTADKLKDVFTEMFSYDNLFTESLDEFGNSIYDVSGQVAKVLKESSAVADEVFAKLKDSMSDTLVSLITDQESMWTEIFGSSGVDTLTSALDTSFATVQTDWQTLLSNMGSDLTAFLAGTDFGEAFESLVDKFSNVGGIFGQLIEASLNTVPEIVTNVIEKLPVYFDKLNTNLMNSTSQAIITALNNVQKVIGSALNVTMPDITYTPTVTSSSSVENTVYESSIPSNYYYYYSVNAGNIISSESSMKELATILFDYWEEMNKNKW